MNRKHLHATVRRRERTRRTEQGRFDGTGPTGLTTMIRLIIPLFALLIGVSTVLASGGLSDRRGQSGDAFLQLLEAAHGAALEAQRNGTSR